MIMMVLLLMMMMVTPSGPYQSSVQWHVTRLGEWQGPARVISSSFFRCVVKLILGYQRTGHNYGSHNLSDSSSVLKSYSVVSLSPLMMLSASLMSRLSFSRSPVFCFTACPLSLPSAPLLSPSFTWVSPASSGSWESINGQFEQAMHCYCQYSTYSATGAF